MKGLGMDSARIISDYRRDGVVRVRSLLVPERLREVREAIRRYQERMLPDLPSGDYTLEPDGSTVRNLWRMERHDPFFADLSADPRLLDLVRPLVNDEPVVVGVETFNKPALVGSVVPPHQDNAYFCLSPPDVLTVWIAIDPATEENGAVEYAVGSHVELLPHAPSGVKGNSFGLADPLPDGWFRTFRGTVEPGDALIHHGRTVHWSRPNRSDRSRLSLVIVYRGEHTRKDPALEEGYRRALALTPQNA